MGENLDLVSIIIPAYNVEKYIYRCIDSLINQTYKKIEIIIVDDGSTDNTENICLELCEKDTRIIYVKKENGGQGAARNLGIEIANGEFVTFSDADDWCASTYVEKMITSMKRYNSDICVCGKYGVRLSDNGEVISQKVIEQWLQPEETIFIKENHNLIYQIKFSLVAKMFRKELFLKNNILQPNHKYENNTVIPMLVAKAETISMVDKALYYYWMNREGSTINCLSSYFDMIRCLRGVEAYFKKEELWDEYEVALYYFSKWNVIHTLNRVSGMKKSVEEYRKLEDELHGFMLESFPNHMDWLTKKVLIWGSYNLTKTVKNLVLSSNIMGNYSYRSIVSVVEPKDDIILKAHPNAYRNKMIQQDVQKTFFYKEDILDGIDYLFIDLLEERFSLCEIDNSLYTYSDILSEVLHVEVKQIPKTEEYIEKWKSACEKYVKKILLKMRSDQIVLVKYMLSEEYGIFNNRRSFAEIESIKEINNWLTQAYAIFESFCEGCHVIEVTDREFVFSDTDFEYGCFPYYLNSMIYDKIAQKICKKIEERKDVF